MFIPDDQFENETRYVSELDVRRAMNQTSIDNDDAIVAKAKAKQKARREPG